jgi:capsular polysaccharide export protein
MALAGYKPRFGWPGTDDLIAAWGHAPRAARAEALATRTGAGLVRIEDAFLRSLFPGRQGEPSLGLLIDEQGIYYDPSRPSDLETLLATHPLDDHALLETARLCMARLRAHHLSKYSGFDPATPAPQPGYVLVIDQVRGDASLARGGLHGPLSPHIFHEMLVQAQLDHPTARIVIRTHPEAAQGLRAGHFTMADAQANRITICDAPCSPWDLLEGAIAVYTVSSQLGFEAILAGHRPQVWGLPFYAGWGLSEDVTPHPRRKRNLTRTQLFAATMLLYPRWYDPCRDRLCDLPDLLDHLEPLARAWREDHAGYDALNTRLWKRPHLQAFFGRWQRLRFRKDAQRRSMVWGAGEGDIRIEDGILRSRGLGAALTPPLSLVRDDLGIYYDPTCPSRLEALIASPLPPGGAARPQRLIDQLRASGATKYNLAGARPDLPEGHRILVPGQVEDDASIRLGAGEIRTNAQLLAKVRAENPDAVILYKPHPDVEAGLRPGAVTDTRAADMVLSQTDTGWLLTQVDEVWTITSTLGFEALLRGLPVTCLGAPFYAGWGLTRDLGPVPARRKARPDLTALVHAVLIAYPRYLDPVTRLPCGPELALERLADPNTSPQPPALRALAKLQGMLATRTTFWR